MTIIASYEIPHFVIDAYDVIVNRPKTAAYRAPGASNAAFASETIIDELAKALRNRSDQLSPDECRQRRKCSIRGTAPSKRIGYMETLNAIKDSPHNNSKLEGAFQVRGGASGFWFNAGFSHPQS